MSDSPWVFESERGWKLLRLKHVCRFIGGGTPDTGTAEFWQGDIPWVSPKDMKSSRILDAEDHITEAGLNASATRLVEAGAVLIVMRSGILRHSIPVAINEVPVALNQDMKALLTDSRLRPEYLARLIQGHQAELLKAWRKEGATVESLEFDLLSNTLIPIPPPDVQQAIADYLNRETARLDALIAAKERLLGLLAEKREALVTFAITCGLDPNAPLRDSGIPWLGPIPAHWEKRRIAWLFRERDLREEPDLPLLEVSINAGVVLREFSDDKIESTAADFNSYKVARKGDVVFNKMRMWQGAVGVAPEDGLVSPDYVVAAPNGKLLPEFAGLLFRTPVFSAECGRRSHGIVWDRLRLYWDEKRAICTLANARNGLPELAVKTRLR